MTEIHVVTGAGGFIGGYVVERLLQQGKSVRAVDIKPQADWHQQFDTAQNVSLDVSKMDGAIKAVDGAHTVYNLAADMGGMGFIESHKAACMLSVLTSTHVLMASYNAGVSNYFYSSSACVYAAGKQTSAAVEPLRESDAYPAMPEDGYGWEKLFSERMARHFREDYGLRTRVARYHNVYGPHCTFDGGREKAPAAICRKIIEAKRSGNHRIEIWGDGCQTRSFMYVDDCVDGTLRILESDVTEPLNLGSDQLITINELVSCVEEIAGIRVEREYNLGAPKGVRGRNSDNTLIKERLGWAPSIELAQGLETTYRWIHDEMAQGRRLNGQVA